MAMSPLSTSRHLAEMFARLDAVRGALVQPRLVSFAVFFHDAIYEPTAKDNELRSAQARGAPAGRFPV